MGPEISKIQTLELQDCLDESFSYTPLIFVLSSGADPMASLKEFAAKTVGSSKFKTLSLGQGQGNKAKELII